MEMEITYFPPKVYQEKFKMCTVTTIYSTLRCKGQNFPLFTLEELEHETCIR